MHWRVKFAEYLSHKSNFVSFVITSVGSILCISALWLFGELGGPRWWLFIITVSLATAWAWAELLWRAVGLDTRDRPPPNDADKKQRGN
jgi:Fe2+ transport system protein B